MTEEDRIISLLDERNDRDVYESANGGFYITYGGGRVAEYAVKNLKDAGKIKYKWPERKDLNCFVMDQRK